MFESHFDTYVVFPYDSPQCAKFASRALSLDRRVFRNRNQSAKENQLETRACKSMLLFSCPNAGST